MLPGDGQTRTLRSLPRSAPQKWAGRGLQRFLPSVACRWHVGGFLWVARVRHAAAVLLGVGGGEKPGAPAVRPCHWPGISWDVGEED